MCNILLLVPKSPGPVLGKRWNSSWSEELEEIVTNDYWYTIASGVLVLGAIAKKRGLHVDVVDEEIANIDYSIHYDIVAMYTVTPNVCRCYELAQKFKELGSHVALGGVHATVYSTEALQHADTILIGESEYTWNTFLEDFQKGNPQREYKQEIGTVNLQDSPIPLFEAIPTDYDGMIPIQTARGCPHGCQFCDLRSLYGNSYRGKSIEQVQLEIEKTLQINQSKNIYFTDDNLFCMKKRASNMMEMLQEYKLSWVTNTDVSFGMDKELIMKASKAGCRRVLIGLESVNRSNLIDMDQHNFKNKHRDIYEEAIENIQGHGIGVIGSFIVGLDADTEETFSEIYEFVQETGLSGVNITVNTPFPGTEMFKTMKKNNRIQTFDWRQYTIFQPVIRIKNMPIDVFQDKYADLLLRIHEPEAVMYRKNIMKESIKKRLNG